MKQRNEQQSAFSIQQTPTKGWGLFAQIDFNQGDLVIEYVGELIRVSDANQRIQTQKEEGKENIYLLEVREHYHDVSIHTCIDATVFGNEARFVNHSCDPNCSIQIRSTTLLPHIVLVANRIIHKGEEITFHYGGTQCPSNCIPCQCGCSNCCGYIPFSI